LQNISIWNHWGRFGFPIATHSYDSHARQKEDRRILQGITCVTFGRNRYLAMIETGIGFTGHDNLNPINVLFESDRFYCSVLAVETTSALIISDSLQCSPPRTTRSDVADQMLASSTMRPS
jgi:hypothetical protein